MVSLAEEGHYPILGIHTIQDHINIEQRCTHVDYGQFRNKELHPGLTTAQNRSGSLRCEIDNVVHAPLHRKHHCAGTVYQETSRFPLVLTVLK